MRLTAAKSCVRSCCRPLFSPHMRVHAQPCSQLAMHSPACSACLLPVAAYTLSTASRQSWRAAGTGPAGPQSGGLEAYKACCRPRLTRVNAETPEPALSTPSQDAWPQELRRQSLQGLLPPKMYQRAKALVLTAGVAALGVVAFLVFGYVMASPTFGWTGVWLGTQTA